MTITTLPTQTSDSLGSEKSNVKSLTDETHQLSAEQWNETVSTVISLANEVGLSDGSTSGSLNKKMADFEKWVKKSFVKQAIAGMVGGGSTSTSSNLRKWGKIIYVPTAGFYCAGYDNYEYAVAPSTGAGIIAYFEDLLSAIATTTNVSSSLSNAKLNSICRINSVPATICVGYGGLIRRSTSTSLSTWSTITPPAAYAGEYNDIIYIEELSLIVAVGSGGAIHTSEDNGVTFTAQTNPDTSLDPVSIAYGNGVICIRTKGPSGFAITSADGSIWEKQTVVGSDPDYCSQMFFDGENFVCFGQTVSISPDGENWSIKGTIPETMEPRCVSGKNGFYIGAGYDSGPAIVYSIDGGESWDAFEMQNATTHMLNGYDKDFYISSIVMDPSGKFLMMGSARTNTDYSTYLFLHTIPTGDIFS